MEGLSVNLNSVTYIKFNHDDRLPETVQCDLQTLQLAFNTLIEFGMRYCNQGLIELQTKHEGFDMSDRNIVRFGFGLKLSINRAFDEKIIFNLINYNKNQNGQSDLVKRFIAFYDLIDHFGLGMVMLPSIIKNLDGILSVKNCTDKSPKVNFRG